MNWYYYYNITTIIIIIIVIIVMNNDDDDNNIVSTNIVTVSGKNSKGILFTRSPTDFAAKSRS